jgi:hypothetical protein
LNCLTPSTNASEPSKIGSVSRSSLPPACSCSRLCQESETPRSVAIVIDREVGTIARFPSSQHFSSYAGTTPRVSSSGGKTHYGHMRTESNQYLKWAFIEAGNVVAAPHAQPGRTQKHVSKIYARTRNRKGHSIAVGAVARHLAESAFWILTKAEPYKDPQAVPPRQG